MRKHRSKVVVLNEITRLAIKNMRKGGEQNERDVANSASDFCRPEVAVDAGGDRMQSVPARGRHRLRG